MHFQSILHFGTIVAPTSKPPMNLAVLLRGPAHITHVLEYSQFQRPVNMINCPLRDEPAYPCGAHVTVPNVFAISWIRRLDTYFPTERLVTAFLRYISAAEVLVAVGTLGPPVIRNAVVFAHMYLYLDAPIFEFRSIHTADRLVIAVRHWWTQDSLNPAATLRLDNGGVHRLWSRKPR
eukprot:gene33331-43094_t